MKLRAVVAGTCAVMGCSDAPRDGDPFGSGDASGATAPMSATGSEGDGSGGSASVTSGAEGGETEDETGGEPIFEVGNDTDTPGTGCGPDDKDCGCNAVDVLFVVDNSGSMETHRAPVIAAFPQFVDEMVNALPMGTDLHVGLTRATGFYDPGNSGGWGGPGCEASVTDCVFYPPEAGDNGENGQQGWLYEHEAQRYYAVSTGSDTAGLTDFMDGFGGPLVSWVDLSFGESPDVTGVLGSALADVVAATCEQIPPEG